MTAWTERVALTEDAFLRQPCYCGHTRADHRRPGSLVTGRCNGCTDGHYFRKPEHHERDLREAALRADPTHEHGPIHEAIACGRGGYSITLLVCSACGAEVGRR